MRKRRAFAARLGRDLLMDYDARAGGVGPRKPRSVKSLALLFGFAFLAGIAAMGWGLSKWDGARQWLFGAPGTGKAPVASSLPANQAIPLPAPTVTGPDLSARIAEVEARMAKVEAAGSAVGAGSGARAEALLVAFAARRALDRGIGLGYIEGLLTQRFGETQPRAVASIIAAARKPVTLDQLQGDLAAIAPELEGTVPDEDWWSEFKHGLGSIFVVRQAGTAPVDPQSRIERATRQVEEGRVDLALAEISRLPNRARASGWIAMARRYVDSHHALDLLEAAAITSKDTPRPARAETVEPAETF